MYRYKPSAGHAIFSAQYVGATRHEVNLWLVNHPPPRAPFDHI